MNIRLLIVQYDTPDTLTKIPEPTLTEIFTACDFALTPIGKVGNFAHPLTPGELEEVKRLRGWVVQELKRRGNIGGDAIGGDVAPPREGIAIPRKADFLRVIDALCHLRFFQSESGQIKSKREVLEALETVFPGISKNAEQTLTEAYKNSLEANLRVCNELTEMVKKKWNDKEERRDKL
jgi:hypothetical protein